MKSILIRPCGPVEPASGKPVYFHDDHDFDMLSFLANEFDNQHITAVIVEVEDDPLVELQAKYARLQFAAKRLLTCWEGGDLAESVRHLNRVLDLQA
jgi:hypothetical protein